jgi:hypothetical protein
LGSAGALGWAGALGSVVFDCAGEGSVLARADAGTVEISPADSVAPRTQHCREKYGRRRVAGTSVDIVRAAGYPLHVGVAMRRVEEGGAMFRSRMRSRTAGTVLDHR